MRIYSGSAKKGRVLEQDVKHYKGLDFIKKTATSLRKKDRQEAKAEVRKHLGGR